FLVRHLAPLVIEVMFDSLVHPGVYRRVGLAGWATWWKVKRSPGAWPCATRPPRRCSRPRSPPVPSGDAAASPGVGGAWSELGATAPSLTSSPPCSDGGIPWPCL
ncbi:MAG: hypothetical protein M3N15_09160, partial [Actinomycetota bacterium]|nr:hypothetical protein [Actinomycetota bacterium]